MSAFYPGGSISPDAQAWFDSLPSGPRYGGGPGDVGFGPGVLPDWAAGRFTPMQQQSVQAVANNPNLLHGFQSAPIPQWQIDAQFPGGSGWVPGVTPMPPGFGGQAPQAATAPVPPPAPQAAHSAIPHLLQMIGAIHEFFGHSYDRDSKNPWGNDVPKWYHPPGPPGGTGGGPGFDGGPVHQGGPGFDGGPVHQGTPRFLGPPVRRPPGQ